MMAANMFVKTGANGSKQMHPNIMNETNRIRTLLYAHPHSIAPKMNDASSTLFLTFWNSGSCRLPMTPYLSLNVVRMELGVYDVVSIKALNSAQMNANDSGRITLHLGTGTSNISTRKLL